MRAGAFACAVVVVVVVALGCGVDSDVSRELGARCDTHEECEGSCLASPAYPGGFCTINCNADADCPSGATCVDRDQGICLFRCTRSEQCEFLGAGWECDTEDALPDGEAMVCDGP